MSKHTAKAKASAMAKAEKRDTTVATLGRIIERARKLGLVDLDRDGNPHWYTAETMGIDLSACLYGAFRAEQAVPGFSLERLEAFDDFSFLHDVTGIARHLNRETGEMGGHFTPRCARGNAAKKG
ncbi:MAG: hypothetical protein WAW54_17595 [Parvibaculum sedimenti]|uniref:DUF6874 family protein n=1 Tax=Parvibaculum sedimenti TaxID=2608632 RepID=UPI003BB80114